MDILADVSAVDDSERLVTVRGVNSMEWISAYFEVMIIKEPPLVLALDTSTVVNVGLARGDQCSPQRPLPTRWPMSSSSCRWSECVDTAGIRTASLDLLIVGLGPGPFTGLRVGVNCAGPQLCIGSGVAGVCSLDVLAAQFVAASRGEFVVATDARRREVYWAR